MGEGIGAQRVDDLRPVLGILPLALVLLMIGEGTLAKGHRSRRSKGALGLPCLPIFDRIDAVEQLQPCGLRPFARLLEADDMKWTEAEHPLLAMPDVAEDPARRVRAQHLQVKAVPVVEAPLSAP